jgi:hypothetical protein
MMSSLFDQFGDALLFRKQEMHPLTSKYFVCFLEYNNSLCSEMDGNLLSLTRNRCECDGGNGCAWNKW